MINDQQQQHINQQHQKSRQFCQNNLNQNQFLEQQQPHNRFVYSNLEALNVAGYSGSMAMISGGSQQQHPQQPQQCHQMVVNINILSILIFVTESSPFCAANNGN